MSFQHKADKLWNVADKNLLKQDLSHTFREEKKKKCLEKHLFIRKFEKKTINLSKLHYSENVFSSQHNKNYFIHKSKMPRKVTNLGILLYELGVNLATFKWE